MTSKINIKLNFVYNIIYQILTLITPLVTAPYISRVIGAEGIGNYSFTQSIVMYFSLIASIGSGTHGQRGIAGRRDDKHALSVFFCEVVLLKWLTTIVSLGLYSVFILTQLEKYKELYLVQSITIMAVGFDITWLFQGIENFRITVTTQILAKILSVIAIFIFVKSEADLLFYVAACNLPTLIGYFFLWPNLRAVIEKVEIKDLHPFKHLKPEIQLFIPYIGTLLFSYIDKTMLGYIMPDGAENGYYEQALKFITMATAFISAISTVVIPRMAYYFKETDNIHLRFYTREGTRAIMCLSCLLAGGMFSVSSNIIPWFYGEGYDRSIIILQILSVMMFVKGINNYYGSAILIPSFRQNKYAIGIWCSAGVNIIFNSFLIKALGAVGAGVASVISEFVLFAFMIYYVKELISIGEYIKNTYKYIISCGISSVATCMVSKMLGASVLNTIILVLIATVSYCLSLLLLKDEFFWGYLRKSLNLARHWMMHR